jgi:hypothetical protein
MSELLEEQGPNGIEAWPQYMANPKVPATD